jgi:Family of unknown function (DUF6166)
VKFAVTGSGDRRYVGELDSWGRRVWVDEGGTSRPLSYRGPGLPVPLAWGRRGIGARELSRAILLDATGNAALAERYCRELTHQIVAELPELGFDLSSEEVLAWLAG